jgi:hypothetical protein
MLLLLLLLLLMSLTGRLCLCAATVLLLTHLPCHCSYGVGRIGWLSLTGFIPTRLKSRNIAGFADKYRQQLVLQP